MEPGVVERTGAHETPRLGTEGSVEATCTSYASVDGKDSRTATRSNLERADRDEIYNTARELRNPTVMGAAVQTSLAMVGARCK